MTDAVHSVLFFAAVAAVTYGFWLAWAPLGWIVPGMVVLACVIWTRTTTRETEE